MINEELVKASLESEIHRAEYADSDYLDCVKVKDLKLALELIKDLQEDNALLEAEVDKQYEQAKADILGNMANGGTSCHWCIEQHELNAIKQFAERLKARLFYTTIHPNGFLHLECINVKPEHIDNLVKEWGNNNR